MNTTHVDISTQDPLASTVLGHDNNVIIRLHVDSWRDNGNEYMRSLVITQSSRVDIGHTMETQIYGPSQKQINKLIKELQRVKKFFPKE